MVLGKILRKNLHRHSLLLQGNHQKNRLHQRQRLLPKLDLSMNYSQKVLMDEYNFSFYNHLVSTVDLSARQWKSLQNNFKSSMPHTVCCIVQSISLWISNMGKNFWNQDLKIQVQFTIIDASSWVEQFKMVPWKEPKYNDRFNVSVSNLGPRYFRVKHMHV